MAKRKPSAKALALGLTPEARQKKIEAAIEASGKLFGKGSLGTLEGVNSIRGEFAGVVPTGSKALDEALGIGGYPKGRVVEVYGPEASGKTTLTLHAIAEVQKAGGTAAFIDAEHALDPSYAEALGVNLSEVLLSQPDNGEQALETVNLLVDQGIDIIVIDSVAALVPKKELEGDMGDNHPGAQARLMSQAMRKLTGSVHKGNTLVIFINQVRMKIGVMFGSPKTTSGGQALKFYSSVRLEIARIGGLKQGEENYGNRCRVKVKKNKLAPPFKQAEFDLVFGIGIDTAGELLDLSVGHGILSKKGAWYSLGDERIGMGRKNVLDDIRENPDLRARLQKLVDDRES
jgi:recombination protein RecA